jgi:6-phospho-3-hexuloisomerase
MDATNFTEAVLAELSAALVRVEPQAAAAFVDALLSAKRVFVAGAGRSGLIAKAFAMRLMHFGVRSFVVGEMVTPNFEPDDLLIVCSGSGETGSLVAIAGQAKRIGGRLALVTIAPGSTIARLADVCVVIPAPSPKQKAKDGLVASTQPMGALFEQAQGLFLDCTIVALMRRTGADAAVMFQRHANLE